MSEWLRAYLKFAGRLKEVRITLPVKHDLKPSNRRRYGGTFTQSSHGFESWLVEFFLYCEPYQNQ